jgi:hypothetical protein
MPQQLPAVLIGIAATFDVLTAISIPLVPQLQLYIVGFRFREILDNITSFPFSGQVNSAQKSLSVDNLVELQVKSLWFFLLKYDQQADRFPPPPLHPFSWASGVHPSVSL